MGDAFLSARAPIFDFVALESFAIAHRGPYRKGPLRSDG